MSAPSLEPAMRPDGAPEWPGARWVGTVDVAGLTGETVEFAPRHCDGYRRARILLRRGGRPLGFVEADIVDDRIRLRIPEASTLPTGGDVSAPPPITVVLCTRERPDHLAGALASVVEIDYPDFEVVVVDNAPASAATARVVAALGDPRVRRVVEPVAGLSNARNAGLRAARHEIVAFTDDDVVVDAAWLRALAHGFARGPEVSCVAGMVPSGELRTVSQAYFDRRVSWSDSLEPRSYVLRDPPPDLPLFPFQVGSYGTGANFAVRRSRIHELGGFDEALGAGTATKGGEDIDMFFRVLMAGDVLANEPAAIVWHRHRSDADALLAQARGYGLGLGAWLTKVALDRRHRRLAFAVARRRLRSTARAGAAYGAIATAPKQFQGAVPRHVGRTEVLSVLAGPWALWRGRRAGRRATPFLES